VTKTTNIYWAYGQDAAALLVFFQFQITLALLIIFKITAQLKICQIHNNQGIS